MLYKAGPKTKSILQYCVSCSALCTTKSQGIEGGGGGGWGVRWEGNAVTLENLKNMQTESMNLY